MVQRAPTGTANKAESALSLPKSQLLSHFATSETTKSMAAASAPAKRKADTAEIEDLRAAKKSCARDDDVQDNSDLVDPPSGSSSDSDGDSSSDSEGDEGDAIVKASIAAATKLAETKSVEGDATISDSNAHDAKKVEKVSNAGVVAQPSGSAPAKHSKRKRGKRSDGLFPCRSFDATGSCKFGDKCRFSHLGTDDPGLPEGVESVRTRKRNAPCFAFQSGKCQYGKNCRYKHVKLTAEQEKEAREIADIAAAPGRHGAAFANAGRLYVDGVSEPANAEDAVDICYAFQKGECTRGAECKFKHTDLQAAKLRRIMALPQKARQRARAIFFNKQRTGQRQGMQAHGRRRGGKRGKDGKLQGECFAFKKGECTRGDACLFQHVA
jgi:hypothetical protein